MRRRAALLVTALLVGTAVWLSALLERRAASEAGDRVAQAQRLATSMVEQERGLWGFQVTGDESFLLPVEAAARIHTDVRQALTEAAEADEDVAEELDDALTAGLAWRGHVERAIEQVRREGPLGTARLAEAEREHRRLAERFRAEVADIERELDEAHAEQQRTAAMLSVAISLLLVLLIAGGGLFWWRRTERTALEIAERDRRYTASQAQLAHALQLVAAEDEANALLQRHLERTVAGSRVTVLNVAPGGQHPEARTAVADEALAEALDADAARTCLAARLARPHEERAEVAPLLTCEVCGKAGVERRCTPLVVSGEVIGSVLAISDAPLGGDARRRLDDSVMTTAPVLGNLRAMALAEQRASTDALTGLPNRRAVNDTLKRMIAQAGRSLSPLTAIAVDLDRFKDVNDRYGHDKGDEVLAAAAAVLQDGIRSSDFAGRMGGEEFIVLAPDTDADGGAILAEHLRQALERLTIPGVERRITASFGVATFPVAPTAELLLRTSDRALYAAKEGGRNRVKLAPAAAPMEAPA